jgi:hypothetical protein
MVMLVRAALYLDFDNFFLGLAEKSSLDAERAARSPSVWLNNLASRNTIDGVRLWLVRRCYLNPDGYWLDATLPAGHTDDFRAFRQGYVDTGFEVVDCPALTSQGKNAADICLVVDVMAALHAPTRFDEFVIMSGDADLTPLLRHLRAADRRITVLSTTPVAKAYRSLADQFFDRSAVVQLIDAPNAVSQNVSNAGVFERGGADAVRQQFRQAVQEALGRRPDGVHMGQLGNDLRSRLGPGMDGWFGHQKLSHAILYLNLPGVTIDEDWIRLESPVATADPPAGPGNGAGDLPAVGWDVTGDELAASDEAKATPPGTEATGAEHDIVPDS